MFLRDEVLYDNADIRAALDVVATIVAEELTFDDRHYNEIKFVTIDLLYEALHNYYYTDYQDFLDGLGELAGWEKSEEPWDNITTKEWR